MHRPLRFAFPTVKFSPDRATAMQIFHHHTHIKTLDAAGPAATHQDGGSLKITIADRLSWQRYHLTQNLAVTQINGRSSGVWKNDYAIHLGYDHQFSLGWISETYKNRVKSYTSRNSYVAVSFSPPDHRFNLRVLRGQNAVAGRPNTFRSYRLEVGWSFPYSRFSANRAGRLLRQAVSQHRQAQQPLGLCYPDAAMKRFVLRPRARQRQE